MLLDFVVNVGVTTLSNTYVFVPNQGVAVDGVISGGDYPYSLVGVGTDVVITGGGDYTPYVWLSKCNNVRKTITENW